MITIEFILKILEEQLGLVIYTDEQEDFSICDYVYDSLVFIQFIIAIEEKIGKDLTDDFLDYDLLSSAKGFAAKLDSFISTQIHNESIIHEQ